MITIIIMTNINITITIKINLITSVGFGNVASETDNEKIFSILMMIVAGNQPIEYVIISKIDGKQKVKLWLSERQIQLLTRIK